jgi:pimeloyl-ACP methyl ester carboxylesterase
LHGRSGTAATWWRTARWLAPEFRVVALDARGHGASDRPERLHSPETAVADAEATIEQLGLGPALTIGHGVGALTAWQLAGRRPELVRGLVAAEMRCAPLTEQWVADWGAWFSSWPLPFDSLGSAREWFETQDPSLIGVPNSGRADYYTEVMEQQEDGLRPQFALAHVLSSLERNAHEAHWDELAAVRCPMLVVRGLHGILGRAEAQEMVRMLACGSYAEVPGAGHLLHAEQPDGWRRATEPFLTEVATTGTAC